MPSTLLCNCCQAELVVEDRPPLTNERFRDHFPSQSEFSHIQSVIQAVDQDIDRHDAEINRLSRTLATLGRQRDDLRAYRDRCRALVGVIQRVSPEIWVEIFSYLPGLFVVEESYKPVNGEAVTVSAPAVAISRTCLSWRKIALNTPSLWTDLYLSLDYDLYDSSTKYWLDLYLLRSKTSLLTLDITVYGGYPKKDSSVWATLQSLFDSADRWETAKFQLDREIFSCADAHLTDTVSYSRLKFLKISSPDRLHSTDGVFSRIWQHAATLQSLETICFDEQTFRSTSCCLRTLTLDNWVEPIYVLRLLHSFPALQHLTLRIAKKVDVAFSDSLICTEIRSMSLHIDSLSSFSTIFESFKLPSLIDLDLTAKTTHEVSHSLKNMVQRSNCCLQTLNLRGQVFADQKQLFELLAVTPTVTSFRLDVGTECSLVAGDFFQRLTFKDNNVSNLGTRLAAASVCLLPKLRHFYVAFDEGDWNRRSDTPEDTLPDLPNAIDILTMINSRRSLQHVSPPTGEVQEIASFKLRARLYSCSSGDSWVQTFYDKVEPHLRALKEEGLELSLRIYNAWAVDSE
ncbi:hypothetical protein D9758_013318 [Tetrapyrgos nigripes]|uniref:F-box domain-containing protein n=1 Tax=Tetrapyrgos nigripes TaxID=182062 RepID=A0A8H5CCL7_9AGAR|nr:hypothetical protein D9758_013318 [Tetrapyrgos nigripes]